MIQDVKAPIACPHCGHEHTYAEWLDGFCDMNEETFYDNGRIFRETARVECDGCGQRFSMAVEYEMRAKGEVTIEKE